MAYGKIKADTLVYDNSGSDVETSISSLAAKASLPASAGTVGASEVVQVDANKDTTGIRNLTISGNLQVNGTTTTVASSTMTVTDKNIEIAKGAANDAAADGAGITVESGDGNITWNWVDASDAWTSSENLVVVSGKKVGVGTTSPGSYYCNHLVVDVGSSAQSGITIVSETDKQGQLAFADGTSGDARYRGYIDYHHNTDRLSFGVTGQEALAIDSSKNATFAGSVTDSKGDVRNIPINSQTSGYTLVVGDAGKVVATTTGGWTIPASVFTTVGQVVTLLNNSASDQTITASALTYLYNTADGTNIKASTITLGARGMATIWFDGGATGYIQSSFLTVS